MPFPRLSTSRKRLSPVNPSQVNTGPRTFGVKNPRATICKRLQPNEDFFAQDEFVYELNYRERRDDVKTKSSSNIQPSPTRGNEQQEPDRQDLNSFWSYVLHCMTDPCCGDLERVLYKGTLTDACMDDSMIFFDDDTLMYTDSDDDDDDTYTNNDGTDTSLEVPSPSRRLNGKSLASSSSRARTKSSFTKRARSFILSDTMCEI